MSATSATSQGQTGTGQQVAGSALQGVSSIAQGLFARRLSKQNAVAAEQQAAAEETRSRRTSARRLGRIRAAFGASGGTFEGSPIDVLADQAAEDEEDTLLIRFGGRVRARQARISGRIESQRHFTAAFGSFLEAGETLLDAPQEDRAGELT